MVIVRLRRGRAGQEKSREPEGQRKEGKCSLGLRCGSHARRDREVFQGGEGGLYKNVVRNGVGRFKGGGRVKMANKF